MKLWKKILIGVAILAALGLGLLGYGTMKVADVYSEKIKPDMQRYVQMTREDQDKYVIDHLQELMKATQNEDSDATVMLEAMQNNPDVRQAGIEMGRSVCASLIGLSDDIMDSLSPEDKKKYEQEAKALDSRTDRFEELLNQQHH